jgi:integrase
VTINTASSETSIHRILIAQQALLESLQPTHASGDWPLRAMKCGFGRDLVMAAAAVTICSAVQRIRVHDLKHTFGRRLRAAGVSFEDRQDLLGHRSGRITTHYSQAGLTSLIEATEIVCNTESPKSPATTWLRRKAS